MRESSNPVLNTKAFNKASAALTDLQVMTVKGTVQKTILMALLVLASAMWSWSNPGTMWMMIGGIGGFIAALVTIFKP
ncbi:MAG: putative YccA/Bax inhibitor family protein, partial [Dokdonia sp.]